MGKLDVIGKKYLLFVRGIGDILEVKVVLIELGEIYDVNMN